MTTKRRGFGTIGLVNSLNAPGVSGMSISITVNGEARPAHSDWTVADLLLDLDVNNRYCAVERNRELIPREEHHRCQLQAGDQIEIVTLVGGG